MRPTRFRGVIGFGDQKYVERMSNYRILIGDPGPGDLRSRDGQYRPDPRRAPPFQAFGEGSNPVGDAGPEITNGLGAFLYVVRSRPGFGRGHVPKRYRTQNDIAPLRADPQAPLVAAPTT
jgi:hypothetical protein